MIPSLKHPQNIFEWLNLVRQRPSMYLGTESPLKTLETIIWGYETALWVNGVVEGVPHMNRHFLDWLDSRSRQRWSCARGFAAVIEEHTPPGVTPLQFFFELIDKYQRLIPTEIITVFLKESHAPTGKCVRVGIDGRIERPDRISIIRYKPTRIHFLRFYYRRRVEDQDILKRGKSLTSTTIEHAKEWVRDEFNVLAEEWQRP